MYVILGRLIIIIFYEYAKFRKMRLICKWNELIEGDRTVRSLEKEGVHRVKYR